MENEKKAAETADEKRVEASKQTADPKVVAEAKKDEAQKAAAEKAAAPVVENHDEPKYWKTSDGQLFYKYNLALLHARTLDDKSVVPA